MRQVILFCILLTIIYSCGQTPEEKVDYPLQVGDIYFNSKNDDPSFKLCDEIRYNNLTNAWKKGVDWFPTLNPTWKNLIGAGPYEVNQTGCECSHYNHGNLVYTQFYPGITICPSNQNNGQYTVVCNPTYEVTAVTNASDAFILAESAMNMPRANYEPRLMQGSNHLQMRNDSEMGKAVDAIFFGGLDRPYFKTDFR
ncbi:MAG TPA: hypothetical protein PKD51_04475 [Saprospiraceae bacterium]|nr:hypothetical protein [Saprospiraceae bacterium]HMU03720.1 hypothetical protein [Saprospiraceae bacterium]